MAAHTMTQEQAVALLESWREKLKGRQPTAAEQAIIDRYDDIADGRLPYRPEDQGDDPDDL
jgi:hypothetical protein